jgi:hypothetical protein
VTVLDAPPFRPPTFVAPAHLWIPPGRRGSYGPEIVDFSASIGHGVDAEQAAAIDALASYGPGGLWHTLEVAIVEGRQNGKTDRTILPITLADFFVRGVERIVWTAHLMDTCRDVFLTVQSLIDANVALSRRVKHVNPASSEESVTLMSGAVWDFRVRTSRGGRGKLPYDVLVLDEALFVTAAQMGARLPTLSSRPNPHVRYASSPALAESAHLRSLMRRGRSRSDRSLTWVEYCAPGSFKDPGCGDGPECTHAYGTVGCILDREDRWHLANHAMGRRISYGFVRNERATLHPTEFARERNGWHEDGPEDLANHPLDAEAWAACAVDVSPAERRAPMFFVVIGVDGLAVIGSAADRPAAPDGSHRPHFELADRLPAAAGLADRLGELAKTWPGARFGASKQGPVAGMVEAGTLPVEVELISPGELAQSCRHHQRLTFARGYTWRSDPTLRLSFTGAVSKPAGDGMWSWDWRASTNLAEIASQGGALWLLEKYRDSAYDPLDSVR